MHPFQSKQFTANGIWNLLNLSIFNSMHSSSCSDGLPLSSGEDTLTYKLPFLLGGAEVGTANVCSVILLLYVFFADWILISWYFIFQIFLYTQAGHSPVLLTWRIHFSPWVSFLISALLQGWNYHFGVGNIFPSFSSAWEVKTLTDFLTTSKKLTRVLFSFLAWLAHNLTERN